MGSPLWQRGVRGDFVKIVNPIGGILPYNDPSVVIPGKAGIQTENTGFRIKSGITRCVKLFLRH
jgi:hypothetical protein